MTGAGIMLMVDDEHRGTFGSSDSAIDLVEDLQFTLGEGPCIDTYRSGRPVLEPDLAHPSEDRWHGFAGPALAAGVVAIFGFPLLVGDSRSVRSTSTATRPGDLEPEQFADAMSMADIAAHAILDLQADAAPGALASELDAGVRTAQRGAPGVGHGVGAARRPGRRRARPCCERTPSRPGRPIHDVARDVVDRDAPTGVRCREADGRHVAAAARRTPGYEVMHGET